MRMLDAAGVLPGVEQMLNDRLQTNSIFYLSENERPRAPHCQRVASHHSEIRSHRCREIGLVDDEQVRLSDARASFAWNLVPARHVNDLHGEIRELPAEGRGQIVPA